MYKVFYVCNKLEKINIKINDEINTELINLFNKTLKK